MTKRKPTRDEVESSTYTYQIDGVVKHTNIKRASELKTGDRTDFGVVEDVHVRRIFTYVKFKRDDDRLILKTLPHDYRVAYTEGDGPIHFELATGGLVTINPLPQAEPDPVQTWEDEGGH